MIAASTGPGSCAAMENLHLHLCGRVRVVSTVFVLVPLLWLRRKGIHHTETLPTLVYLACFGAGLIMI